MNDRTHLNSLPERTGLYLTRLSPLFRNLLLIACGAMTTSAFAPFHAWLLLAPAFSIFFWLANTTITKKRSFWDGWWFGFGFFVTSLYWFAYALLVDAAKFGWMVPFAVFGLSAFFAVYTGVAGLGFYFGRSLSRSAWPFWAATVWSMTEWLRGYLFTGFPWNSVGYVFTASDASMQSAAWLGTHGLSFLAVWLAVLPAMFFRPMAHRQEAERYGAYLWAGIILLASLVAMGQWRLNAHPTRYVENADFRMVQAGVQQYQKWDPREKLKAVETHAELTRSPGYEKARFIVWSETSMTYSFISQDDWAMRLASLVPPNGLLMTGVVRIVGAPVGSPRRTDSPIRIYNSLQVVDGAGSVVASYDKRKLVPFGEFVPFRGILPINKITKGSLDFSTGDSSVRIPLPDGIGSLYPMICYEAIFPELGEGAWPSAILNITNDTWFGDSTGPYQHLAMSRMRAVEEGVPVLRDANSGVSAVIDSYGRIVKSLGLNQVGIIDSPLPSSLSVPTFIGRYGSQVFVLLLVVSVLFCIRRHHPIYV